MLQKYFRSYDVDPIPLFQSRTSKHYFTCWNALLCRVRHISPYFKKSKKIYVGHIIELEQSRMIQMWLFRSKTYLKFILSLLPLCLDIWTFPTVGNKWHTLQRKALNQVKTCLLVWLGNRVIGSISYSILAYYHHKHMTVVGSL